MGFQDRVERKREEQAQAAAAKAERAARDKAARAKAGRESATQLLPEVRDAAEALRADRERSERQLMPGTERRYVGAIGAIVSTTREEKPGPWYQLRPSYRDRRDFAGWCVRYYSPSQAPFGLEIPLTGDPSVVRYGSNFMRSSSDQKWTLEAFADGGIYEYRAEDGESGPVRREISADKLLHDALQIIEEHLLYLPPTGEG
ncbi:MAG TPA: hypothetical protein VF712_12980 [Thermoleophilaceae bacterium]